jgi:hypothetical protein
MKPPRCLRRRAWSSKPPWAHERARVFAVTVLEEDDQHLTNVTLNRSGCGACWERQEANQVVPTRIPVMVHMGLIGADVPALFQGAQRAPFSLTAKRPMCTHPVLTLEAHHG